jgi:hypothetical protein
MTNLEHMLQFHSMEEIKRKAMQCASATHCECCGKKIFTRFKFVRSVGQGEKVLMILGECCYESEDDS